MSHCRLLLKLFYASLFAIATATSAGAEPIIPFRSECVGRMQFDLPSDVEVAGYRFRRLRDEIKLRSIQQQFEFDDGEEAGFSSLRYSSDVFISNELSSSQLKDLTSAFQEGIERSRKRVPAGTLVESVYFDERVNAYRTRSDITFFVRLGNYAFFTDTYSRDGDYSQSRKNVEKLLANLTYRQMFTQPVADGVCLPHFFIADTGAEPRKISVTYRMKSHPDVTFWLEDKNAEDSHDATNRDDDQSLMRGWINSFWNLYAGRGEPVVSKWKIPGGRTVNIDGKSGLSSFVEITRRDGSKNLAYLAVVRGDPQNRKDTPDLRFYAMQQSEHATAEGVKPISEKDFLDLAQRIASSIKHHK